MGKSYIAEFKPLEPYFFGNEKIFSFEKPEKDKKSIGLYYIKSEAVPSQSTITGALRYMFLPVKKTDWSYNADEITRNNEAVGESGFDPETDNSFGKIEKISPVFIIGESGYLVPTPFDHKDGKAEYTPFTYVENDKVKGPDGKPVLYTDDYKSKDGVTSAYMSLKDNSVVAADDIFDADLRTGIARFAERGGYFKKEYKMLREGYSFAVYVTLDDGFSPKDGIVHMGQGKSAFAVTFREEDDTLEDKIKAVLNDKVVYCLGDAFISSEVYKMTRFAVTKTKTYRHFRKTGHGVEKGGTLYNLVSAGSIFIPENKEEFLKSVEKKTVSKAGYNVFIAK